MRKEFSSKSRKKRAKIFEERVSKQVDALLYNLARSDGIGLRATELKDEAARTSLRREIVSGIIDNFRRHGDYIFGPDPAPAKTDEDRIREMIANVRS